MLRKVYPPEEIHSPCHSCEFKHYDKLWPFAKKLGNGKVLFYSFSPFFEQDHPRYSDKHRNPCPCKAAEAYDQELNRRQPIVYGPAVILDYESHKKMAAV